MSKPLRKPTGIKIICNLLEVFISFKPKSNKKYSSEQMRQLYAYVANKSTPYFSKEFY